MTQVPTGPMRDRIVVEEATDSADGKGTITKVWRPKWTLWTTADLSGGGEVFSGQRLEGRQQASFGPMHRVDGLSDKHRLIFGGKVWDITAIEYPPDGKQMTIRAFQRDA